MNDDKTQIIELQRDVNYLTRELAEAKHALEPVQKENCQLKGQLEKMVTMRQEHKEMKQYVREVNKALARNRAIKDRYQILEVENRLLKQQLETSLLLLGRWLAFVVNNSHWISLNFPNDKNHNHAIPRKRHYTRKVPPLSEGRNLL